MGRPRLPNPTPEEADRREKARLYYRDHREKLKPRMRRYSDGLRARLKRAVIAGYGGKCARCGFSDERALSIDHMNGDGGAERRATVGRPFTETLWRRLIAEGFPRGHYQLLCMNCQFIKSVENGERRRIKSDTAQPRP